MRADLEQARERYRSQRVADGFEEAAEADRHVGRAIDALTRVQTLLESIRVAVDLAETASKDATGKNLTWDGIRSYVQSARAYL